MFPVEHYVNIRNGMAPGMWHQIMCFFGAHLKMTTCAKIVPVVLLLASSRQGIPCLKGKCTSYKKVTLYAIKLSFSNQS